VEELWTELVQDDYYLDYLKSVANLKSVVDKKNSRARITQIRAYWRYAAAAVVALLLGVLFVLNYSSMVSAPEVSPIDKIQLDYYRSSSELSGETGDKRKVIREAITMANKGNFEGAVALLKTELNQAEDPAWVAEIRLNLGSLFYNKGFFEESLTYYQKVLENREGIDVLTLEKAYWYMGNAYFQLEQLDKARTSIENAYELNGAYRRVAQSYLKALAK
jgi:tetratricopeptide (TPR) repeat protein